MSSPVVRHPGATPARAVAALLCRALWAAVLSIAVLLATNATAAELSVAINHGRVIDPETGLDAIAHVGIRDGRVVTIAEQPLRAPLTIDATGLVVSPGFIDLHTHSPTPLGQYFQAFDGVTTALELEAGYYPVREYGGAIAAQPLINYGASAGHAMARILEKDGLRMSDAQRMPMPVGLKGWWTALKFVFSDVQTALAASFEGVATADELQALQARLDESLDAGALGIGLPLDYFSAAIGDAEMRMLFSTAAERGAPVFVHIRRGIDGDIAGLHEVIDLAREYGAPVHVCHITHNAVSNLDGFLQAIRAARGSGVDITTEVLPYNAGSALISSAVFGRDWQTIFNISYEDVQWAETGEWFTREMWEDYYRNRPDGAVIHHYLEEEWTRRAVQEPGVIIVSDLVAMVSRDKKVAPHNGAFSKVLARYVREHGLLDLATALGKMTLLPARRLETYAPSFRRKGRLQPGADADITIFDPDTILDNATYMDPFREATGIEYLLVNGELVIAGGELVPGSYPGRRLLSVDR